MPSAWISRLFCSIVFVAVSVFSTAGFAEQPKSEQPKKAVEAATPAKQLTANEVVEQVTEKMLSVIKSNQDLLTSNPGEYFAKVDAALSPAVAFPFIARSVMGQHFKASTTEQREAFAKVFQQTMVETIAKGMANYADSNITVRPSEADPSERRVTVMQDVKGPDGDHSVSYSMAKTKEGDWKLLNVVLNGVNLGKNFKTQFAQAARQYKNDYDKVIANWGQ